MIIKLFNQNTFDSDFDKRGFYFKSENDVSTKFMVEIIIKDKGSNAQAIIYEIPIPQENAVEFNWDNGTEIQVVEYECDYFAEIDIWNKYYFPKFNNEMQWYHDDHAYPINNIQSMCDVMKFALSLGLKLGEIKTY